MQKEFERLHALLSCHTLYYHVSTIQRLGLVIMHILLLIRVIKTFMHQQHSFYSLSLYSLCIHHCGLVMLSLISSEIKCLQANTVISTARLTVCRLTLISVCLWVNGCVVSLDEFWSLTSGVFVVRARKVVFSHLQFPCHARSASPRYRLSTGINIC